jgi:uncharacterized protein (TIGR03083 family)
MEPDELFATARSALDGGVQRLATVIRPMPDLNQPLPGESEWTAREAIAHLVKEFDLYTEIATGTPSPVTSFTAAAFAEDNRHRIADVSENDPTKLAFLLEDAAARFLTALRGQPGSRTIVWHAGLSVDLTALVELLLGEVLLHGYDVAVACRAPWPMPAGEVALVLAGYAPCYEPNVNPETTRGLTVAYELDLRGVARVVVRFVDGRYSLEPADGGPVDCVISADPVAWLLVGSGRLDQWAAIALGLIEAGGERPELAAGFGDLFIFP